MNHFFSGGDFRFFWKENLLEFARIPSAWDNVLNTGIGQSSLGSLWITSYLNFSAYFGKLGLSWEIINLLLWIIPSLVLSFVSAFLLSDYFFSKKRVLSFVSGIIYVLNTYFILLILGGQMGVALSYSLVPFLVLSSAKSLERLSIRSSIISGLAFSLSVLFDPRIFYITLSAIFIYTVLFFRKKNLIKSIIFVYSIPLIIVFLLHNYWIIPLILTKSSPIPAGFDSPEGFKFLSFADFSHALSFLHPNWPENVFGKTSFQKPEFLVLPIIAFSSLLVKKSSEYKKIAFFALLILIGSFLSKGVNEPFGIINHLAFQFVPGMSMFRDPTKWYILISLGYSILIPVGIYSLKNLIFTKFKKISLNLLIITFLLFYFSIILPDLFKSQKNLFKPILVPRDYQVLADYLKSDKFFYRTLWVPAIHRYGFFSNEHPSIGRGEIFKNTSLESQLAEMNNLAKKEELKNWSVKYVIVPYDPYGEIFQKDRRYSKERFERAVKKIEKIPWLKRVVGFGNLAVFEIEGYNDHFYSPNKNLILKSKYISPSKYEIFLKNAKKGDVIVFSESFSSYWNVENHKYKIGSQPYRGMNSFKLPQDGEYSLKIVFSPQKTLEKGLIVSFITLISLFIFLANNLVKNRKNVKIH